MGLMEELGGMLGGEHEVNRMANGQANFDDPKAFNRAATQVGQQNPSLLSKLLNNKMLMVAAAGLAAKIFMNRRQQPQ